MNQHDLYAIFRSKKHIVRDFSISWGQRHHPLLFRSCRASLRCPFKDIMPWSWSTFSRRSSPQNSSWINTLPMNWGSFIEDGGGRVCLFDTPNVKWYVLIIWIIWNILELLKFWKMNLVSRCQKKDQLGQIGIISIFLAVTSCEISCHMSHIPLLSSWLLFLLHFWVPKHFFNAVYPLVI